MKALAPFCAVALALGLFLLAAPGSADPASAAPAERIGYVDLAAVLDAYPEKTRTEERLRQWRRDRERVIEQIRRNAQEKYDAARQYKVGSAKYEELVFEARELDIQYKVQEKLFPQEQAEQWKKEFKRLYTGILDATRVVAKRHGYTVVLKIDPPESLSPAELGPVEMTAEIKFRSVLYYSGESDITQDVVAEINR